MDLIYLLIFSEVLILLGLIGTLITSVKLLKILRKNERENSQIIKEIRRIKMTNYERMKNLEKIANKYGVNMEETYPVTIEDCDEEFEEVDN